MEDDLGPVSLAAWRGRARPEVESCLLSEKPIEHFVGNEFSEASNMEIWVL